MDQFTALTVFRAIAENGSFAAAARALDLSTAAVSKNVRELESSLGVALVIRNSRSTTLTQAGHHFATRAHEILLAVSQAHDEVAEFAEGPRGVVRISAPMSIGLLELAPLLPGLLAVNPDLKLDIEFDDRHVDIVARGFDVAIRGHGPLPDSNLRARRLAELRHVLCAAPTYLDRAGVPLHPEELSRHACLLYSLSIPANRWVLERDGQRTVTRVDGLLRANNSLALRHAALGGIGIVLLPSLYVCNDLAQGTLVSVLSDWTSPSQGIYALHAFEGNLPRRVRTVVDAFAAQLSRNTQVD